MEAFITFFFVVGVFATINEIGVRAQHYWRNRKARSSK